MWKKYGFYFSLIIIYLLVLTKDSLFSLIDNKDSINEYLCSLNNLFYKEEFDLYLTKTEKEGVSIGFSYRNSFFFVDKFLSYYKIK